MNPIDPPISSEKARSALSGAALVAALQLDVHAGGMLWKQLYGKLLPLIESGDLGDAVKLPSERDLALALGLSRATVRRCYDELRSVNRLGGHGRGRGGSVVRVTPKVTPRLGKLKGFTQEMQELGMTASTRLEALEVICDRGVASIFGRPSSALFLRVVRVRYGDALPMTREVAIYDITIAPALKNWDGNGSAYAFLKDVCLVELKEAYQTVEAVNSSPVEMQAFDLQQPIPCLLFKRKSLSSTGQLVEYVEGTFRGDAYVYQLRLGA